LNAVDRIQDGFGASLDSMTQKNRAQDILIEYMKGGENCKEIGIYGKIILKRILRKRFLFTI